MNHTVGVDYTQNRVERKVKGSGEGSRPASLWQEKERKFRFEDVGSRARGGTPTCYLEPIHIHHWNSNRQVAWPDIHTKRGRVSSKAREHVAHKSNGSNERFGKKSEKISFWDKKKTKKQTHAVTKQVVSSSTSFETFESGSASILVRHHLTCCRSPVLLHVCPRSVHRGCFT